MDSLNEPEEGEIIDDYELISSDEEAGMRQRIKELEEKNFEIECIARISRSYEIERAARVPTDVSSISSTEFKTPRKNKRHKNKEHKKKSCHHHHSHRHEKKGSRSRKTRCKRREKLLKKKHDKYAYKEFGEKIAFESADSLDESSYSSSSQSENEFTSRDPYMSNDIREDNGYSHHIRDTLRLAISRHRKNSLRQQKQSNGLKEKLFTGSQFNGKSSIKTNDVEDLTCVDDEDDDDAVEICEPVHDIHIVPDESSDSLEEKELRLIALKSAVLKKHMERKRRNAEAAYSPTDFDGMMIHDDKLADIDVVDLEEDDSQIACGTASPIASPQLMLLDGQDDSTEMDCKPVDMDIANSDSEEAPENVWKSMNMPPQSIPLPNFAANDFNMPFSYNCMGEFYASEMSLRASNPPPPGVEEYEEEKPMLSYEKFQDIETQDMELENEDFVPIVSYPCSGSEKTMPGTLQELNCNSNGGLSLHSNPRDVDLQEEEEELALRALLLSKFQSPKNQKRNASRESKENTSNDKKSNTEKATKALKPTEAILKEAVKRLKIHTQNESQQEPKEWHQKHGHGIEIQNEDNGPYEIPMSWNHDKLENDCFEQRVVLGSTGLPKPDSHNFESSPLPWEDNRSNEIKTYNGDSDEFSTMALINLQKKAKQLQSHSELVDREIAIIPRTNDIEHNNDTGHNQSNYNPPTLDEDSRRRLQKLKEEILSATGLSDPSKSKTSDTNVTMHHPHSNSIAHADMPKEEVVCENLCTHMESQKYPEDEKQVNETAGSKEDIPNEQTVIEQQETIANQMHFDKTESSTKSKTKHITNVSDVDQEVSKNKITLKENNVNSVNKKTTKMSTEVSANKTKPTTQPIIKKVAKIQASKGPTITKPKETKPNQSKPTSIGLTTSMPQVTATTTATTNQAKAPILPTYSVLRTTKIVKPNKVINRNVEKRKVVLIQPDKVSPAPPAKVLKVDPPSSNVAKQKTKSLDTSRLITSMDQVKHMCNVAQLVISVQNSSNESSDEEWANCDAMYRTLSEYNDMASPLSLNMGESPCLTPRSNSPIEMDNGTNKEKPLTEDKSKNKHSPVMAPEKIVVPPKTPVASDGHKEKIAENHNLTTPIAVRHLPPSVQDEYRKLVHRMKMLENQRIKKESGSQEIKSSTKPAIKEAKPENEGSSSTPTKQSLVKQVLLRNANKPTTNVVEENATKSSSNGTATTGNKTNVLRNYESLYAKIGSGIVNNLDKSLRLVEEAKKAKVKKLKLEERLKELKAEMDMLQTQHKEEEQKIARIYPSICTTNEVITSLKQKRSKIFKAAIGLGKTIKGDDYRLNNDLKQNIMSKTKLLAAEIKLVNSLKITNINKLKAVEEISKENKEPPVTENANNGLEENKEDHKLMSKEEQTLDCQTENDDESRKDISNTENMKSSIGGTTEFQESATTSNIATPATNCDIKDMEKDEDEKNKRLTDSKPAIELDPKEEETSNDSDINENEKSTGKLLPSYISPLEHLRCNNEGNMDPNGVICPFDLMGNCEDVNCKYVHISGNQIEKKNNINESKPS
ncbi:uncharacterized protein LOC142237500 [Haematobia irritans]|uniref:uncharacterized protein LOC142237500 n=1 Tax=Haematobia irritans TaxID=7368 RepID=UPI003F5081FD